MRIIFCNSWLNSIRSNAYKWCVRLRVWVWINVNDDRIKHLLIWFRVAYFFQKKIKRIITRVKFKWIIIIRKRNSGQLAVKIDAQLPIGPLVDTWLTRSIGSCGEVTLRKSWQKSHFLDILTLRIIHTDKHIKIIYTKQITVASSKKKHFKTIQKRFFINKLRWQHFNVTCKWAITCS